MLGQPMRLVSAGAWLTAVALSCTGCTLAGGASGMPQPPSSSVSATASVTPSATASETATATPSQTPTISPAPSPTPTLPVVPLPSATGLPTVGASVTATPNGPVITVPPGTQRAIVKSDAFSAGPWVQGGFHPANSTQTIEALATTVGCNNATDPIEFRFSATSGTLVLGVAQALDSPSSTEKLAWSVVADGRQTQTVAIGFRETQEVSIPLAGVSSVQIRLGNPSPCNGTATGLIVKAVVNG